MAYVSRNKQTQSPTSEEIKKEAMKLAQLILDIYKDYKSKQSSTKKEK